MRHLLVLPYFPYPPDSGGPIRTFNLLRRLAQRHDIDVIAINDGTVQDEHMDELKKHCSNVYIVPSNKNSKMVQRVRAAGRLLKGEPPNTKYVALRELEKLIWRVTRDHTYDTVQFEHSYMAGYYKFVHPQQKAKRLLIMHDVMSLKLYRMFAAERRLAKKTKYLLTGLSMLRWEPKMASKFDKIIVMSEVDRIILQVLQPGLDISVVANGIDTNVCRPYGKNQRKKNILIVGNMEYEPNEDAVMYFYHEVFPVIRKNMTDCTLTIVGKNPPYNIRSLKADPQVTVEANVKQVHPYYEKALVSAVALRSGGGTRLKILESMSFGVPVVSTSIGCEGLQIENKHDILIADNATDFANSLLEILSSPTLWSTITANARILVEEKYDWNHIARSLEDVFEELVGV